MRRDRVAVWAADVERLREAVLKLESIEAERPPVADHEGYARWSDEVRGAESVVLSRARFLVYALENQS